MIEIEVEVKIGSWAPPTDAMEKINAMLDDAQKYNQLNSKVSSMDFKQREILSWLAGIHKTDILFENSVNDIIYDRIVTEFDTLDPYNILSNKVVSEKFAEHETEISELEKTDTEIKADVEEIKTAITEIEKNQNEAEEEFNEAAKKLHTHENADVLSNLSENESGNLTYNGKEIGGSVERATGEFTVDLSNDGASRFNGSECLILLYEEFENVTAGTEIKDIQFMNSDGKYISIKNLAEVDLIGYIPLFHKVFSIDGVLCYAVIRMIDATYNWVLSAIQNGLTELWMKVIYYID